MWVDLSCMGVLHVYVQWMFSVCINLGMYLEMIMQSTAHIEGTCFTGTESWSPDVNIKLACSTSFFNSVTLISLSESIVSILCCSVLVSTSSDVFNIYLISLPACWLVASRWSIMGLSAGLLLRVSLWTFSVMVNVSWSTVEVKNIDNLTKTLKLPVIVALQPFWDQVCCSFQCFNWEADTSVFFFH